jgi:hypothetical protein
MPDPCDADDDAGTPCACGGCVTFSGLIWAGSLAAEGATISVSILGDILQTTSDANGAFALQLPRADEAYARVDAPTYYLGSSGVLGAVRDVHIPVILYRIDTWRNLGAPLGIGQSDQNGALIVAVWARTEEGGEGATIDREGVTPVVTDASYNAVARNDLFPGSRHEIYFFDLAPGPVVVTPISPPGRDCYVAPAGAHEIRSRATIVIEAAAITNAQIVCADL